MSVSLNDVRVATRQHLELISDDIESDWEGQDYTPTNGVPYQSIFLLNGSVEDFSLSFNDSSKSVFILQVTLMYPSSKGTYDIETRANEVITQFNRGLVLSRNGINIRVENTPTVSNLGVIGDREARAISINLTVYK